MKPKNFPARKLRRQLVAQSKDPFTEADEIALDHARSIRTKKVRGVGK